MAKIVFNAADFSEAVSGQYYQDVPANAEGSQFYPWIMRLTNRGVMLATSVAPTTPGAALVTLRTALTSAPPIW